MNDDDMHKYNKWLASPVKDHPFVTPWIEREVIVKEGNYYVKKLVIMTPSDVYGGQS